MTELEYEIELELEDDEIDLEVDPDLTLVINQTDFHLEPATTTKLGGVIVGEDLEITPEGVLSVTKATSVGDNSHPITAAAVYAEVGNINALLQTI